MKSDEKLFEVILAPIDMLEKELEDVLGGMGDCGSNKCHVNTANCIDSECNVHLVNCSYNRCGTFTCPPGYTLVNCECVPVE